MIIETLEVKNYRCIRDAKLDCSNLTAILGRNGAGKSAFLYALDVFYDIAAAITEEDFFDHDIENDIEIRVTYGGLRVDEKEEFKAYTKDNKLIVTKRISFENGNFPQRYYGAALQIPQFAEIRKKAGKSDRIKAWNELVDKNELIDLTTKAKSSDQVEKMMHEYEKKHPEFAEPIEREEQFFGAKNIGGGRLDKFTRFVLVPAVREASEETGGKRGAIYQLIDMIVLRKVNARKDIIEFKTEFENKVKKLYSSENLTELPQLGDSISEMLVKFAPGAKLMLRWDDINPPAIQLPSPIATMIEDEFEGEISRKGHGLQRALILTLLQQLALTTAMESSINNNENRRENNLEEEEKGLNKKVLLNTPDLILAIEEPELYLHPSRSRYLSELFLNLTSVSESEIKNRNQIIYATHSPYFVDLNRFDQIRVVRKIDSPDSKTRQSVVSHFSLQEAATELAKITDSNPSSFTSETFKARAINIMNIIVNEGFFADVVVVVEGTCEVGVFWKLQEILKANWDKKGIVIVPADGKNNIDRPVVIFRGLSIPTYFIFDGDVKYRGKKENEKQTKTRNLRYLKLAQADVEDFPPTQVRENWAVFEDDLEAEIKKALTEEVFYEVRKNVAEELAYEKPEQAVKNVEGAAKLIETIYRQGYSIPTFERVVQKINELNTWNRQLNETPPHCRVAPR